MNEYKKFKFPLMTVAKERYASISKGKLFNARTPVDIEAPSGKTFRITVPFNATELECQLIIKDYIYKLIEKGDVW